MQLSNKNKRIIFWSGMILILTLAVTLGVLNWSVTKIHFIFFEVQGRLIFILLIFFFLGFFLGKLSHFLRKTKKEEKKEDSGKYTQYIEEPK